MIFQNNSSSSPMMLDPSATIQNNFLQLEQELLDIEADRNSFSDQVLFHAISLKSIYCLFDRYLSIRGSPIVVFLGPPGRAVLRNLGARAKNFLGAPIKT